MTEKQKSLEVLKKEEENLQTLCQAGYGLEDILEKTRNKIAILELKHETEAERVKKEGRN